MNNDIFKRLLSSLFLIPTVILIVIEGNIIFNSFLAVCLIISLYEWYRISLNKLTFFFGLIFLIFSFYLIFQIRNFYSDNNLNLFNFMFILILCISTDIGGYLIGKTLKGPRLTKISPNKTISGSLGSYSASVVALYFYFKYSYFFFEKTIILNFNLIIIILIISSISQAGDLLISLFKRKSNLKDTGNLIPVPGGLLDRIDGIIFAFPFFYFLISKNLI